MFKNATFSPQIFAERYTAIMRNIFKEHYETMTRRKEVACTRYDALDQLLCTITLTKALTDVNLEKYKCKGDPRLRAPHKCYSSDWVSQKVCRNQRVEKRSQLLYPTTI